jgi:hypothetical protein
MIKDAQTLKIEITASLDTLSLENLQLLHGFVTLLSRRTQQPAASPDNSVKLGGLPEGSPLSEEEIPAANRTGWKEWDQRFDQ